MVLPQHLGSVATVSFCHVPCCGHSFLGSCDLTPISHWACCRQGQCMNHSPKTKTERSKARAISTGSHRYFKTPIFAHRLEFSSFSITPDVQFENTGFRGSCWNLISSFFFPTAQKAFSGSDVVPLSSIPVTPGAS